MHSFGRWPAVAGRACIGLSIAALCGLALPAAASPSPSPAPGLKAGQEALLHAVVNQRLGLDRSTLLRLDADLESGLPLRRALEIDGDLLELDLRASSVRAESFTVYLDVNGELHEVDPAPEGTFIGEVVGAADSLVVGGLSEWGMSARINFDDGREFYIEPVAESIGQVVDDLDGLHVLYSIDDVLDQDVSCGTTENFVMQTQGRGLMQAPDGVGDPLGSGGDIYRTELAIDADFRYFQRYGESGSQNRIQSIINTMNVQYERDVQIRHLITTFIIRTTNFPPEYQTSNMSTLLNNFRAVWIRDHQDIPRDVAELFVGLGSGGVIGIAWLGVICDPVGSGLGYNVVKDFGGFSCRTDLSAHELGHNWNAPHCDPCSSTMRSSLGCFNFFVQSSINFITSHRNTRSCLDVGPDAPENDNCADAQSVGDGRFAFRNTGSTEEDTSSCDGLTIRKDVWFRYTASCDGVATASVCDADYNTRMGAHADDGCPDPTPLACNDDACGEGDTRSSVSWPVEAGETYLIQVGAFFASGEGDLVVSCDAGPACPADLDGSGAVDFGDILAILEAWGPCDECPEDLDNSGAADFGDILVVLENWGPCE